MQSQRHTVLADIVLSSDAAIINVTVVNVTRRFHLATVIIYQSLEWAVTLERSGTGLLLDLFGIISIIEKLPNDHRQRKERHIRLTFVPLYFPLHVSAHYLPYVFFGFWKHEFVKIKNCLKTLFQHLTAHP